MIQRSIVNDTVKYLEMLLDSSDTPHEELAQINTLLNMWRLYANFSSDVIE